MGFKFNPLTGNLDLAGSGGSAPTNDFDGIIVRNDATQILFEIDNSAVAHGVTTHRTHPDFTGVPVPAAYDLWQAKNTTEAYYVGVDGIGLINQNPNDFIISPTSASGEIRLLAHNGSAHVDRVVVNSTKVALGAPTVFSSHTTAERDALTAEAGMVLFNTTTSKLQCYDGATWQDLF